MDIAARLQELEDLIASAKSMPLSSSAIVNREEILSMIDEMRQSLPEEIRQARWVVKDRDEVLAKARRDADGLVQMAREEQLRLASQNEIVRRADDEAQQIRDRAKEDARRVRLEAEDYIEGRLAQFETALQRIAEELVRANGALSRTIGQVQVGRDRLRGPATAGEADLPPLVPEGFEEEA